jgi:vitamin B12 transporter
MKRLNISLVALLAASALPLSAQTIELEPILVFGNLEQSEASRTGANVSVVDEANLKATATARVTDILSRLPGVSIRATGPLGTQAGLTLRGVPQTNIAVRIDGIDVSDPSGTQVAFNFGGLTSEGLSRIEVLKGSQSALYGSEAIGGAINFTTRRATEEGTFHEAALEYGSFDTLRASYGLATKAGNHDLALTLSRVQSDGYSAADKANGNTEDDGFKATRLSFAGGYTMDSGARVSVAGFAERSWFEYDEEQGGVLADWTPDEAETKTTRGLRTALEFTAGGIEHTLDYAFFDSRRSTTGTNSFGPFRFDYTGRRNTFGYRGAADVGAAGRAVFGAESVTETYADASVYGSQTHDTTINSVYGEYSLAVTDAVDVTATLRYDDHERFGDFTTGRLSAVWRATDALTLRANLANGFRAPSNYELFDAYAGNSALTPETSTSVDLGAEIALGSQGKLGATFFRVETEDLIDYSFTSYAYVQRPGMTRRQGVELTGEWAFAGGVVLTGGYTYTDATTTAVLDSSSWSADVPRHMLSMSVEAPLAANLSGILTVQHAADREELGDYTVVNATLTRDFGSATEGYLRIENLFDEDYQLVPGYGTSDRAFYVGLRKSF